AVGVGSSAPCGHSGDGDGLWADVARRGFELFETTLRRAWDDGRPNPHAALENVGRAYLAFARDEAAHYSAMFEAGIPLDVDPGLREAANRAFEVLRHAAEVVCAQLPAEKRPPALMLSLHVWALSHGIASLF